MIKKWIFIGLAFVLSAGTASAQTTKMSLQDCIDYALKNNVKLKISNLNIERGANTLEQSKAARLPNLNASAGHGWNFGRSVDPFTNAFTSEPVSSSNGSLSAGVTLFSGFRLANTVKRDGLSLEASRFDYADAQNNLALNLINAYLDVVFRKELLENAKLQLKNTQEQLDRTMKMIRAGSLPESDKYNLLSQKANNELDVTNAENAVVMSTLTLKQFVQIPDNQAFDIVIPEINEPGDEILNMPVNEVYALAETMQPNIRAADLRVKTGEIGVEIAKGGSYPSLSASANVSSGYSSQGVNRIPSTETQEVVVGYLTDDPGQTVSSTTSGNATIEKNTFGSQINQNRRQSLNLSLQIPIFSRKQVKSGIISAKIQAEQSRLNARDVRNIMRQTIEKSYTDAVAADKSYKANKIRVESLEQTLKVTEQRFNLGSSNATDLEVAKKQFGDGAIRFDTGKIYLHFTY